MAKDLQYFAKKVEQFSPKNLESDVQASITSVGSQFRLTEASIVDYFVRFLLPRRSGPVG